MNRFHRSILKCLALLMGMVTLMGCLTINVTRGESAQDAALKERIARLEALLVEQRSKRNEEPVAERLARVEAQAKVEAKAIEEVANSGAPGSETNSTSAVADASEGPLVARNSDLAFRGWSSGMARMGERLEERFASSSNKGLASNRPDLLGMPLRQRRFVGPSGGIVDLGDYEGSRNLLIVFMRGFSGQVCIGCAAQTVALLNQYGEFERRETEVVVVYPGNPASVPVYVDSIRNLTGTNDLPPFPVLLDANLNAVTLLDIKGSLAKPTALIVDKKGIVRYAYVGKGFDDRPAVTTLLAAIDDLGGNR
jgi:peroxiredoxin